MLLNFRKYNFNIKKSKDNTLIFDIIRKKYIILTPEEWVRQHVINYLIEEIKVPKSLISVEKSISIGEVSKRFDIVSFDKYGNKKLLVECKSPDIEINEKTLKQAMNYQSVLKCPFLMLTNGLAH